MNLLVVCPHYAPDVAPTGEVMTSIVTELARRGHRLHVVTALVPRPSGGGGLDRTVDPDR